MVSARRMLVVGDGTMFSGKTFLIQNGKRHWVTQEWLYQQRDISYPSDVLTIPDETLAMFCNGQPTARSWTVDEQVEASPSTVGEARGLAASQLTGMGLEVGAGASPFPVPLECNVIYGDAYTYGQLLSNIYAGQQDFDIVRPFIQTDFDGLCGVTDESMNFIVACHVIEHTKSPIRAICNAFRKLKAGGFLVLVIPDRDRTFDRRRNLTSLDHLIVDYYHPSSLRDQEHYRDFYAYAENYQPDDPGYEDLWRSKMRDNYSIHFHTWVYESFKEMVEWIGANLISINDIWSLNTRDQGIEFYFTLRK